MGKTHNSIAFPSTLGKPAAAQTHRDQKFLSPLVQHCPQHSGHGNALKENIHLTDNLTALLIFFFQFANLQHVTKRTESFLGNLRSEKYFSLGSLKAWR